MAIDNPPPSWGYPRTIVNIAGHPLHSMLLSVPITCFTGALITDIVYALTAEMTWTNFSAWLLAAGLVFAVLAFIAGLIDFLANRDIRQFRYAQLQLAGEFVVLVLALINSLVHTRDAWTSVVPTGLALSIVTVLVSLITGWLGGTLIYRHRVGVSQ